MMNLYKFSCFLCVLLMCACTPKQNKNATSSGSTNESQKANDEKTYMLSLPAEGKPLTITPVTGYKINADFPHRAQLTAGEIKETAMMAHEEKKLTFSMPKASKLPKTGVQAEVSFSVCNDHMCKLYKEKLQW